MLQLTPSRSRPLAALLVAAACIFSGPALAQAQPLAQDAQERPKLDVIYVPTPQEVVDRMLEMAQVKSTDFVIATATSICGSFPPSSTCAGM